MRPGFLADLVIVDGSPLYNLRFLYSFGALTLDEDGAMIRTNGIVHTMPFWDERFHTIKDGIVIENKRLMDEVERMVAESKQGIGVDAVSEPFTIITPRQE